MAKEFTLPDPGEGIHEAEIIEVKVSEGDRVEEGDPLFIVETDKAEVDVPAPFTGTVEKVMVSDGDDVRVGDVLLTYSESSGSGSGNSEEREDAGRKEPEDGDDDAGEDRGKNQEGRGKKEADDGREEREEEAEAEADKEKEEHEEEEEEEKPEAVENEDDEQDGEEKDEEEEEEKKKKKKKKERAESEDEPRARRASDDESERSADEEAAGGERPAGPVPAAPSPRRLARELGVDREKIRGRGDEGRVTDDDVREAAGEEARGDGERAPKRKADGRAGAEEGLPPSKWPLTPRQPELPDFERWGAVERLELRGVRRATAQRMALAWSQVPHVTHEDIADITELEQFRRSQSGEMESRGAKLTLTTLVVKAVVAALKEFPRFNASLDPAAGEIVLKRYYHVGVAVATDRGLLVPVIRDADRKTVIELATELQELAERARDGDLELEEMRGGTFSITNPGGIGGTRFTPIVNFPQVAILGCGRARLEPVAEGEIGSAQVSHRFRLPLCLGFDHRVNDGADAARFVNFIRELLGDPQSFTLAV